MLRSGSSSAVLDILSDPTGMDTLNALLTQVVELLLAPFRHLPVTGLVFWSVVIGIVMTYVFGKTSNQRALRRAADNIRAQLFGVKLFKEDLVVTFQCQVALLRATGMRLLHSIPPMLAMIAPLFLVLTQLAMRYEFRPLVPGEKTVVAMRVKPKHWKDVRDIELSGGDGVEVETEALRDEKNSMIYWRVRAATDAVQLLQWHVGDQTIRKQLPISPTRERLLIANPKRTSDSWWEQMLHPAEPSLPAESPIESVELQLPKRDTPVFGWHFPWWATFFLVSMIVAYVAGQVMGVHY